ncbi:MAG: DoxX family protein [Hyphomicrobium sp.]
MNDLTHRLAPAAAMLGRVMLVAIFLIEGWSKISFYAPSAAYMDKFGVPGLLLPAAIAIEIGGALLIAIGWQTRLAALALAVFCVVVAVLFHGALAPKNTALHFWKDIAIAGGFLLLFAHGPGPWSLDERQNAGRSQAST